MERRRFLLTVAGAVAIPLAATAQQPAPGWSPAPRGLARGLSFTIVDRNPETGQYTVHTRIPPGYTVGPHWHKRTHGITVLSGTYLNAWGRVWDPARFREVRPGESIVIPAFDVHFWATREETVVQSTMTGPYEIEYVLDADDPRE